MSKPTNRQCTLRRRDNFGRDIEQAAELREDFARIGVPVSIAGKLWIVTHVGKKCVEPRSK